jgi:hypothetical protein
MVGSLRWKLWGVIGLGLAVLAVSGVLLLGGREMPAEQWDEANGTWLKLVSAQADRLFPERFASLGVRRDALREQYHRLSASSSLFRDTTEFESALQQYQRDSLALLEAVGQRRRQLLERQSMEIEALARLLEPGIARILVPEYRKQRASFQMRLGQARTMLDQGEVFQVAALLDELKSASDTVRSYLDELEARFVDPELLSHWGNLCEKARRLSLGGKRVLLVDKYQRKALVLERGRVTRSFQAELGWNGLRDKQQQGDGATPEGEYRVTRKKAGRDTIYYKALLLNYPNDADRASFRRAVRTGAIRPGAEIGGLIEIHGEGGRGQDWTDGCVALENSEMDTLFALAQVGMPVMVVGRCPNQMP